MGYRLFSFNTRTAALYTRVSKKNLETQKQRKSTIKKEKQGACFFVQQTTGSVAHGCVSDVFILVYWFHVQQQSLFFFVLK